MTNKKEERSKKTGTGRGWGAGKNEVFESAKKDAAELRRAEGTRPTRSSKTDGGRKGINSRVHRRGPRPERVSPGGSRILDLSLGRVAFRFCLSVQARRYKEQQVI